MMRSIYFPTLLLLSLVGGTACSSNTPAAAPSAGPRATSPHYLAGAAPSAGDPDPCALPIGSRGGAWVCADEAAAQRRAAAMSPRSGVCSAIGCWYYQANYWAIFEGQGTYGYGGTRLGDVTFLIEVKFSGSRSTSRPFRFESSRGTRTVDATGERIYFSAAHPEGNPVSGGASYREWGDHGPYAAGALVNCFGTSGYTYVEGTVAWAGVAHQIQWTDPSSAYPGTWWVWVKSPKFQHRDGTYVLANPPQMGNDWYGSGWTP